MFVQATSDGVMRLPQTDASSNTPQCRCWPFIHMDTSEVRVFIVNKNSTHSCDATLTLNSMLYGNATVTRLQAPSLLSSVSDMTLNGQSYSSVTGKPIRNVTISPEPCTPLVAGATLKYTISTNNGSVALVRIPYSFGG